MIGQRLSPNASLDRTAPDRPAATSLEPVGFDAPAIVNPTTCSRAEPNWTAGPPVLRGRRFVLRELTRTDAAPLVAMLTSDEVAQFISSPPETPQAFERFIQWAIRERQKGKQLTFGIVPDGCDHAVGLVQVRAIAPMFSVAEWGFAVGSPFWGTGLFLESAKMALDYAFRNTAVNRLEARAAAQNVRGNGALRKLGAVHEGVLRGSLLKDGKHLDQTMWSILSQDWFRVRQAGGRVH